MLPNLNSFQRRANTTGVSGKNSRNSSCPLSITAGESGRLEYLGHQNSRSAERLNRSLFPPNVTWRSETNRLAGRNVIVTFCQCIWLKEVNPSIELLAVRKVMDDCRKGSRAEILIDSCSLDQRHQDPTLDYKGTTQERTSYLKVDQGEFW